MYENLDLDLNLKLLFMVTGAHYDSGLFNRLLDSNRNRDGLLEGRKYSKCMKTWSLTST